MSGDFNPISWIMPKAKDPDPIIIPTAASPTSEDAQAKMLAAAEAEAAALRKRRGSAATVVTGPEGVMTQAKTVKREALGG